MSQSDYIKYKKVYTELAVDKGPTKLPRVFDQGDFGDYKEYTLENTIISTKPVFNRVTPTGVQPVFSMYRNVTSCPTFIDCSNTHLRSNRVPMSSVYFTPTPQSLNWEQTKNAKNQKNACICKLGRSYTNFKSCLCKTAV